MPFPQISQVLCVSGILGALYLPVSISSGRHPHLNIVITRLLLVDRLLMYGSGAGVLIYFKSFLTSCNSFSTFPAYMCIPAI